MYASHIKTILLLSGLSLLMVSFGSLLGGSSAWIPSLLFAGIMSIGSYYFSSSIVLAVNRARPLSQEEYPEIHSIVEELSSSMKLPTPKLYLIQLPIANAFATGRNPKNAVIGITEEIMKLLDLQELRGVLAHELAHVQNRDILIMSIAGTFSAAIGYMANMIQHILFFLPRTSQQRENDSMNSVALLLAALIMPFAAAIMQLSISRTCEYQADETGGLSCHDPLALASALEKLDSYKKREPLKTHNMAQASTAPLFIVNPLLEGGIGTLFSTHPPVAERIKRLKLLYERMFTT